MGNSRRTILKLFAGAAGLAAATVASGMTRLAGKGQDSDLGYKYPDIKPAEGLEPTKACGKPDATVSQTAGPYYTPNTPERASLLEPGMTGQRLVFEGQVLTTDCQPVAGAVVDLWSCDSEGVYHNEDYTLRGHVFTNAEGRFRFETIRPAMYTDGNFFRTPHLHVKVQGRGTHLLTTQVYFPDAETNAKDSIFHESLQMALEDMDDGSLRGEFDFVLQKTAKA